MHALIGLIPFAIGALSRLLRGLAELRKPDLTDNQLLAWAQSFDEFTREMLRDQRQRTRGHTAAAAAPAAKGG